jgi:TonB-linked SusC/RagA family outer membrane protein
MFKFVAAGLLALGVALAPVAEASAQQTGSIGVTVTDRQSGQPLVGAQVTVAGTQLGGVTDANGRVIILQVPTGARTVVATFIGYNEGRRTEVAVQAGTLATVTFQLEQAVLSLQEIIATGVSDPTEGVKLPMTVARIGTDQLQVPATGSALNALAGKVAGASILRTSGQPGEGVNIQLRSLTSIQTDASPMIIVDGVILSTTLGTTSASDIEALDIESIEVIKGAAAAALYGSRAAAGVITITTNRGRGIPQNTTRFNVRTEYGMDVLAATVPIAKTHPYAINEQGQWINPTTGDSVGWGGRFYDPIPMQDKPWPGPIYDNMRSLYRPGQYLQNSFSMSQNSPSTAFTTSLVQLSQAGTLATNKGYDRVTGRITLDHRVGEKINLAVVGSHARTSRDDASGNPYTAILAYPAFVDLTKKDAEGNFIMVPDPGVTIENPLWRQASRDNWSWTARTLASFNLRFVPTQKINTDAQLSYDRQDSHGQVYVPRGTPISATNEDLESTGQLAYSNARTITYNGYVAGTFRDRYGDLNLRLTTRALFEREERRSFAADGRNFVIGDVQRLNMSQDYQSMTSSMTDIRALGYLADLAVDFRDRYIGSFLIRHDGSSLFGSENRWRTFRRVALAYRMSQEDWFDIPQINELKFRYAMGEAGGRPNFADQFELWNVDRATGGVSRYTQGNPNLKPQFTREQDIGIDIIGFNNRVQLELVYAFQTSRDQVITVPAINISGFSQVRANGGTIRGHTYEATIQAFPVRTRDFTWNLSVTLDKSGNEVTYWGRTCYVGTQDGFTGGNQFMCEGSQVGDFYMTKLTRTLDELPSWLQPIREQFQVNDDGYVVWVGAHAGASWRDGLTDKCRITGPATCWGTTLSRGGFTYNWGEPFLIRTEEGQFARPYVGTSIPDLNFGFTNNFTYRGFTFYTAWRGQVGGHVYNEARQYMYGSRRHADADQTGKPDELKKTARYYDRGLYAGNNWVGDYLEDATFLKLGELSFRYRFNQDQLRRVLGGAAPNSMNVGVNGRNLWTLTNYSGFNPESGSQTQRVEYITYPMTRSFTATFDITF